MVNTNITNKLQIRIGIIQIPNACYWTYFISEQRLMACLKSDIPNRLLLFVIR